MGNVKYICIALLFVMSATAQRGYSQTPPPEIIRAGEVTKYKFTDSQIFDGTERTFWVYVPAAYSASEDACLYVALDGIPFKDTATLDSLIESGEIPVMIGVFVAPGVSLDKQGKVRFNRSNEFDTRSSTFARFLETELLPYVETLTTADGRPIRLSKDPNNRMIHGNSSGAICAFTAAWMRPDLFRRVYSTIGTYVWMRGGNEYPAIIRKSEPKPLRIFLEDTYNDVWNPIFGSWFEANIQMESALSFAGYDVTHQWAEGTHNTTHAKIIFPDVLRWLWRDWPEPIQKGVSGNGTLASIIEQPSEWSRVGVADGRLFSDSSGNLFLANKDAVYRVDEGLKPVPVELKQGDEIFASASDVFYGTDSKGRVVMWGGGDREIVAKGFGGVGSVVVRHDGSMYVITRDKEPAVWLVEPDGTKIRLDALSGSGLNMAIFPDNRMVAVTEEDSHWVTNYIVNSDGTWRNGRQWYWLHNTLNRENVPTGNMMFDVAGNLYIATTDGVQVCDHNGRVRAIFSLPTGAVSSLCFGGRDMTTLYVISGGVLFKREMKIAGYANDASPLQVATQGQG
jgi:enterochelin esterase-like enzyme